MSGTLAFESTLRQSLAELNCSASAFAAICGTNSARVSRIISGEVSPDGGEVQGYNEVLRRMRILRDDVLRDYPHCQIVWNKAVRETLDRRHRLQNHDYGVGIRHAAHDVTAGLKNPLGAYSVKGPADVNPGPLEPVILAGQGGGE